MHCGLIPALNVSSKPVKTFLLYRRFMYELLYNRVYESIDFFILLVIMPESGAVLTNK